MIQTSAGIAIFVKTPGISPLKTRLAATEGTEFAEHWYRLAATAVADVARLSGAAVYWAVAEPEAKDAAIWQDLPRMAQVQSPFCENATLGVRMHGVQQQLLARHSAAILLGADTPHLDVRVLRAVIDYLRDPKRRWALAPALDGGFWLQGANSAAPSSAWESVRYSASDTAAQFVFAMRDQGELAYFQSETDVDTAADLSACATALAKLAQATDKQLELLKWMRKQGGNLGRRSLEYPQTNG